MVRFAIVSEQTYLAASSSRVLADGVTATIKHEVDEFRRRSVYGNDHGSREQAMAEGMRAVEVTVDVSSEDHQATGKSIDDCLTGEESALTGPLHFADEPILGDSKPLL